MKVSKVVIIVVALHVLVIGGIFVFEGCSRSRGLPATAESDMPATPASTDTAGLPAAPGTDALQPLPTPADLATIPGTATALAPTALTPTPAPAPVTYAVKKGDSLWKIAQSQKVTVGELMAANRLTKTSKLQIGQSLTIPVKATAPAAPAAPLTAMAVPAGTTVSPAVTMTPTGPAPAALAPTAPAPAAGAAYTVASGDSLWKIANKNGVSVAALKQANNLTSDKLKIGQQLVIPAKTQTAAAAPAATTVSAGLVPWSNSTIRQPGTYQENGQTVHVVDLNESPAVIAKRYGVKPEDLMKANGLTDPKQIHYGQPLLIPATGMTKAAAAPTAPAPAPAPATTTSSIQERGMAAPIAAAPVTVN